MVPPWLNSIRGSDPTKTRAYEQEYTYDAIGNLLALRVVSSHLLWK